MTLLVSPSSSDSSRSSLSAGKWFAFSPVLTALKFSQPVEICICNELMQISSLFLVLVQLAQIEKALKLLSLNYSRRANNF